MSLRCWDMFHRRRARTARFGAITLAVTLALVDSAFADSPKVILKSHPAHVTHSHTAVFRFVSSAGRGRFQCRLDAATWRACTSPRTYVGLAPGRHRLDIRA